MTTTVLHKIDWGKISRDPLRVRDMKRVLRDVLKHRFPRTNLLIGDEELVLLSARKLSKRRNNDHDQEAWNNLLYRYVIPDHVRYWIERGPEELVRSLL